MPKYRLKKGAPGIVEVAHRAGVSPATVSRFYNQPDIVRGPTRKRIEKAAADLGYIRDRLAGAMHNKFSGTFGLVVPTIDNAIFSELIEAFASTLRQHDRTMVIAAHGYDLGLEVGIIRSLLERRIDGVALIGCEHEDVPLTMLEARAVPAISVWNFRADSRLPCIGADNYDAGQAVARHLLERGHRDIAFLFPETTGNDRARDRLQGALDVARSHGVVPPEHRRKISAYDIGEAKAVTAHLLEESQPTAIICGNDIIAHGTIYACQAAGLKIPDDISVVGIGDFRASAHMEPALTTIRLPARRIGQRAAETLLHMSTSGDRPKPYRQAVDLTFYDRGSTRSI